MASIKLEAASISTVASTELNSLASAALALGAEVDNTTNLYMFALFEVNVTFGSSPTANTTIDLYLIPAPDATNYDDVVTGAAGTAPAQCYIGSAPVRAVTSAQKIPVGLGLTLVNLPPLKFKIAVKNGTNQAFPSSGSTVKMIAYRYQSV